MSCDRCAEGHEYNGDDGVCVACSENCLRCSAGACTECIHNFFIKGDECVNDCGVGSFKNR